MAILGGYRPILTNDRQRKERKERRDPDPDKKKKKSKGMKRLEIYQLISRANESSLLTIAWIVDSLEALPRVPVTQECLYSGTTMHKVAF